MDDMGFAGELTVVALGALLIISFLFVGITRFLDWLARRTSKEEAEAAEVAEVAIPADEERKKRERIAVAAVMSYLGTERPGRIKVSGWSRDVRPKLTKREGEKR